MNRANCWNFQSDKINLDMLFVRFVVMSNGLLFYDLFIICVRGKTDHYYQHSTFLKQKRCLVTFSVQNLMVFNEISRENSHVLVSSCVGTSTTAWEKGFSKVLYAC